MIDFLNSMRDQLIVILKTGQNVAFNMSAKSGSIIMSVQMSPAKPSVLPGKVDNVTTKLNSSLLAKGNLTLNDFNVRP